MGPFVRLGGLMSHVERECPSLDVSVLEDMRDKKLDFSRKLETLTHAPVKANYTNYMPSSYGGYGNAGGAAESKPDPFMFEKNQFPKLSAPGAALAPGSSTDKDDKGKGKAAGAWSQGKNLFPNASPAQRPTADQLQAATSPSPRQQFECLDPNHPDHPSFNVARCYSAYTDKYGCPIVGCGKVFKNSRGLIGHLRSTAHSETKYRCPYCLNIFRSLAAITQHAESNGSRCRLRDTDTYDAYLDQLTAGMVDVSLERNDDGTLKYEMSKSFRRGDQGAPDPKSKANGGDPWESTDIQW
ncbi:hypothetical protein ACJ41O_010702 [Fusarium nematophilum]